MKILSKYLAPWAIPNENIPLHIVWDPSENVQEIILSKPEFLRVKEVFNSSYINENDSKVRFTNFESDGYLSIELISEEIETLEKKCKITLELKKGDTTEKFNLSTKILRPKLECISVPNEIKITDDGNDFTVSNPIKLQYQGHGRVYVNISTPERSELQIQISSEVQEVLEKFNEDFKLCLNELRPKYPQYGKFFSFLEKNDKLSLNDMESELEIYSEIFEKDVNFTVDFSEKFSWAVARNYALLDDYIVTPFLEYIRSVPIRTIHLINPISRVNFFKKHKPLSLEIEYFDLKKNAYEPIKLSTKLIGDRDGSIDLYKLFGWESA